MCFRQDQMVEDSLVAALEKGEKMLLKETMGNSGTRMESKSKCVKDLQRVVAPSGIISVYLYRDVPVLHL